MNIFNNIASFAKHFRFVWRRDPERDWAGMLAISVIAFIGIVVWNAWTFDIVANGGVIGTAATSPPPAFNRSSIDATHKVFEERASEEVKYRTGVYRFSDPSQ